HDASRALQQAVAKSRHQNIEVAVALTALNAIPAQLTGDAGWAAVRTAVHGGRVLSRRGDLAKEELTLLWVPLQGAIPFGSLERGVRGQGGGTGGRAGGTEARVGCGNAGARGGDEGDGIDQAPQGPHRAAQGARSFRPQQRRGGGVRQRG